MEIVYPYEVGDAATTRALAAKHGIGFAAINANVKAEPEFRNGGLTSPDPAVRQKAVRFIKEAKDFAEAVGADKVTCCPLGDGYEFAFQSDYAAPGSASPRPSARRPRTSRTSPCSSSSSPPRPAAPASSPTPRGRCC